MGPPVSPKCATGVPGLDDILCGPGVGKTTLALQFLNEGVRNNERCLYVTLSETKPELESVAQSHGWSLAGIDVIELSAIERALVGKGSPLAEFEGVLTGVPRYFGSRAKILGEND